MITIQPGRTPVTLITVHTCRPRDQAALVELLREGAASVYRNAPGFVSASIHASLDGTRVTNYAQYVDQGAFDALRANPSITPFVRKVGELIQGAEPHLYEVAAVILPPSA